jgi:hypothetical protein
LTSSGQQVGRARDDQVRARVREYRAQPGVARADLFPRIDLNDTTSTDKVTAALDWRGREADVRATVLTLQAGNRSPNIGRPLFDSAPVTSS